MRLTIRKDPLQELDADTLCVGLFEPTAVPQDLDASLSGAIQRLIDSGEASGKPKRVAVTHIGSKRVVAIGLGKAAQFDAESARIAAAHGRQAAGQLSSKRLAWIVPATDDPSATAAGLVEGTVLAGYKFDRFKSKAEDDSDDAHDLEELLLVSSDGIATAAERALTVAVAANRARDLQNLPSNEATPQYLADRAAKIADTYAKVETEVLDRAAIESLGMGGIVAVAKGSYVEPKLIVMRYRGVSAKAPSVAMIGKAVTFDSGGISIKPSAKMHEMKMDMSGGAAVIEAIAAIAELDLPIDTVGVVPATENMPSGRSVKPGDIITMYNGKTVEVNNTDAEGRLILADALSYATTNLGAEQLIDLATLTGAIVVALGSTYAGLISNDDELTTRIERAANRSGELAWRLPRHPEYRELTVGSVADLTNASEKRKAGPLYAAAFLEEFVDGKPWAHLDIAGTAWDVGRPYLGNGATGYGVRLLTEFARDLASNS